MKNSRAYADFLKSEETIYSEINNHNAETFAKIQIKPDLVGIILLNGSDKELDVSKAEWFGLYHSGRNEYLSLYYKGVDSLEGIHQTNECELFKKAEKVYKEKTQALYKKRLENKRIEDLENFEVDKYFSDNKKHYTGSTTEKVEKLKEYFNLRITSLKDLNEDQLYIVPMNENFKKRTFNLFTNFEKEIENTIENFARPRLENLYVGLVIQKHCMSNVPKEKLIKIKKREELKVLRDSTDIVKCSVIAEHNGQKIEFKYPIKDIDCIYQNYLSGYNTAFFSSYNMEKKDRDLVESIIGKYKDILLSQALELQYRGKTVFKF